MEENTYKSTLHDKMHAEQEIYRDWLLSQPPDEILNHAFEYTVREDILLAMESDDITEAQAQALLTSPCPLADTFKDFESMETSHMDDVWYCVVSRADNWIKEHMDFRDVPVYRNGMEYASEHDEMKQYSASRDANLACRDVLQALIASSYQGNHLDTRAVLSKATERFNPERIEYVLAATVRDKAWDKRFEKDNVKWAKEVPVAEELNAFGKRRNFSFALNAPHNGLIDLLVTAARKEFSKERKPSVLEKLQKQTELPAVPAKKVKEPSL